MSNILQGKEEYFTLIQKYSHYQPVGRMIEYNQIKEREEKEPCQNMFLN